MEGLHERNRSHNNYTVSFGCANLHPSINFSCQNQICQFLFNL